MTLDTNTAADAVLLAILAYLVSIGTREIQAASGTDPADGVLTPEGVALAGEIVRQSREVEAYMGALHIGIALDDAVYRGYRTSIDRLWRYVEVYGVPALRREALCRTRHSAEG